jgi:hypothetical protein
VGEGVRARLPLGAPIWTPPSAAGNISDPNAVTLVR